MDQPAPLGGAALLGPPQLQRRRWILAGGVGEGTEEAVDAQQVLEPLGVGQGQGPVAAVAELGGLLVCLGGEQGGTQGAEDVMVGGAAGGAAGAEPVHHPELVQDGQAMLGGVAAGEGQVRELGGGEHPMLVQQLAQGPVVAKGHWHRAESSSSIH